jgi:Ca2+-binding RTX toxin-like protein
MAYLEIIRLDGDFVSRNPGEAVPIDLNNDAAVVGGSYLFSMSFSLGAWRDSESIGIRTAIGEVEFPDGFGVGKKLVVGGKEIGVVASSTGSSISFDFTDFTTSAQINMLMRAVTYTDTSTDTGFLETSSVRVTVTDTGGSLASALIFIGDSVQGTGEGDTFSADRGKIGKADELDGGEGDDTLNLIGGGSFNLHQMKRLAGIETIQGTSASDAILINADQLEDIKQFQGNGYGETKDILSIFGSNIDMTEKSVSGFDIHLRTAGATITIDNIDLAKSIYGLRTANDILVITKGILSEAERALLHRNGIDTITTLEDGETTTHRPPQLSAFAEEIIDGDRGKLVYLDKGRDASLIVDEGLLKTLTVSIKGTAYAQENLGVDSSNGVSLLGSAPSEKTIWVDGVQIGKASGFGASLSIEFNASATSARVEKLIQSLTYLNDGGGSLETRRIELVLTDVGNRETRLALDVQLEANNPPGSIILNSVLPLRELAVNDSRICTLSAFDDLSTNFTFQIRRADGTWGTTDGRFKIDGNQLRVANGLLLDYEQAQSHTITIKITDEGGLSRISNVTLKVENLAVENISGTSGSDVFFGGAGRDTIKGNGGSDKIGGGAGNDLLYGGAGKDIFVFKTTPHTSRNKDKIYDWVAKDDVIHLENAIFKALKKTGALSKSFFILGAKAKDSNDFVGYNKATGDLWYDANGSKAGGQVVFAHIGKNKLIAANDFVVI